MRAKLQSIGVVLFLTIFAASLSAASLDPYKLVTDIRALTQMPAECTQYEENLWTTLSIPLDKREPTFGCGITLQEVDWNWDERRDVLVKFEAEIGGGDFRFLVFINEGDHFSYLGFVDGWTKYDESDTQVIRLLKNTFLQTSGSSGGTGVLEGIAVWTSPTPTGGSDVFSFPKEGQSVGNGLSKEWLGSLQKKDTVDGSIGLNLWISYFDYDALSGISSPLFERTFHAVYSWDATARKFELDSRRSTIAAADLESQFSSGDYSDNAVDPETRFLPLYFNELLGIAQHGNQNQKKWLKAYLVDQPRSKQKDSLLKALDSRGI